MVDVSPQEFYARVEAALERRAIPESKRSRVDWHEGGVFSAKREYLRFQRDEFAFDLCGAPFGNAFFVSEWGGEFRRGPVMLVAVLFGVLAVLALSIDVFGWLLGPLVAVLVIPSLL